MDNEMNELLLYDSSNNKRLVDRDFEIRGPDMDVINIVEDICFDADVRLQTNDSVLEVVYKRNAVNQFGERREMICGLKVFFNQVDSKYCGCAHFNCNVKMYENQEYVLAYSGNIPTNMLKTFPELGELFDTLNSLEKGSSKSVVKNNLIIDRGEKKVNKNKRWEIYAEIKRYSTNAHFKDNLIFFRLKDGLKEGIVRICIDGRLECMGRYFKIPMTFLTAFKKGLTYDFPAYGEDLEFQYFAENEERDRL